MAKPNDTQTQNPAADPPAVAPSTPDEWLVAKQDLFVGHVRAVGVGELVHVDTVANNGWDELVEKQ